MLLTIRADLGPALVTPSHPRSIVPVECVIARHIDTDLVEQPVPCCEEIAVGFIDKAAAGERVGHAEAHGDVCAVAGIDEMEAVVPDSSVMRPQPVEHALDLLMSVQFDAMRLDGEHAVRGERLEDKAGILFVDTAEIGQDQLFETVHAGFISAMSFQTICETMVSPSTSNLSTNRMPLNPVPSSQLPERVPKQKTVERVP